MSEKILKLPLEANQVRELKAGQWVNLSGHLYTGRDATLKRVCDTIAESKTPPVDFKGQLLYFVGPTPPAPGEPIGAAGPTTSRRMESFIPTMIKAGIVGIMGKGPLSESTMAELKRHGVIYLAAAGGAGAFYGSKVHGAAVMAYEDLGTAAIYSMQVEKFPAVVALDVEGRDLFSEGPKEYKPLENKNEASKECKKEG